MPTRAPQVFRWGGRHQSSLLPGPLAPSGTQPEITAVEQNVWPSRILITVINLTVGDTVTIYRSVGGVRTAIRGASAVTTTDTALVLIDAEQPYGVPITYVLNVSGDDVAQTNPLTATLAGGKVALSDAVTAASAEVVVTAWPDRTSSRVASTYVVGGRVVVVSGPLGMPASTLELFTEAASSRDNLINLITGATSGVLLIRQPGGYKGVDGYLAVLGRAERRWSQDGSDDRRLWSLDVQEVEAWASTFRATGFTYQSLANAYTGKTYQDLRNDFSTYLQVAQASY